MVIRNLENSRISRLEHSVIRSYIFKETRIWNNNSETKT